MMAPVCGVTCLQRHLSYWIPDGYTAGPGVINLASCQISLHVKALFYSTAQHPNQKNNKNNCNPAEPNRDTFFMSFFVVFAVFCNSKMSNLDAIVSRLNVKPPART